jgi:hypothetical protein
LKSPAKKIFRTLEESWENGYTPDQVVKDTEESHIWDKDTRTFTHVETPIKYYKSKLLPHHEKVLLDTVPICKKLSMLKNQDPIAGSLIESILVYVSGLECQQVEDEYDSIKSTIENKAQVALK